MDVTKSLTVVNAALDEMIGGGEEQKVEKTMTSAEVIAYAKDQVDKAVSDEDPRPRLAHLGDQLAKAMGFDDASGGTIAMWSDSNTSLSGTSRMRDVSHDGGEPPGAAPGKALPETGIPTSSTQGFDDTTNPAPVAPVTTPGGTVLPPNSPPGSSTQGFDTSKSVDRPPVAKSKTGWTMDLATPEFLEDEDNNPGDPLLDFGPDVEAPKAG